MFTNARQNPDKNVRHYGGFRRNWPTEFCWLRSSKRKNLLKKMIDKRSIFLTKMIDKSRPFLTRMIDKKLTFFDENDQQKSTFFLKWSTKGRPLLTKMIDKKWLRWLGIIRPKDVPQSLFFFEKWGEISCQFQPPGGGLVSRYV